MEHEQLILLHEEKFEVLDKRLTTLEIDFKSHLNDAGKMVVTLERHEQVVGELRQLKWWMMGTIVTIIGAVMIWLVSWGAVTNQIKINTERLDYLETLHPRQNAIR